MSPLGWGEYTKDWSFVLKSNKEPDNRDGSIRDQLGVGYGVEGAGSDGRPLAAGPQHAGDPSD